MNVRFMIYLSKPLQNADRFIYQRLTYFSLVADRMLRDDIDYGDHNH
jgi:hypothetical protein